MREIECKLTRLSPSLNVFHCSQCKIRFKVYPKQKEPPKKCPCCGAKVVEVVTENVVEVVTENETEE